MATIFDTLPLTEEEAKALHLHLLAMRLQKLPAKAIQHLTRFYLETERAQNNVTP